MDSIDSYRDQRLAEEIKGIVDQLGVVTQSDAARLSERVFANVFLPFFAGDPEPVYKVSIQHWINAVGGPFNAVSVVDTAGKVLFTIPPLYDRTAVQPLSDGNGPSIAHVVASTTQLANVHPKQGAAYLNNELSKRALIMKVPINVLNHIDTWNEIFTRYGRPPLMETPTSKAESPVLTPPDAEDDFDFQPL